MVFGGDVQDIASVDHAHFAPVFEVNSAMVTDSCPAKVIVLSVLPAKLTVPALSTVAISKIEGRIADPALLAT